MYTARNLEDALNAPTETVELYLVGHGLTDFPLEILSLPNLKLLDLSQNLIRQLPERIMALPKLEILNLRNNQLRQIPPEIGQLQLLQRLDLDENQLAELPVELSLCSGLRTLRISDNSFSNWPTDAFSPQITTLTIAKNQLLILPESIRHLHSLRYLDLRYNRFRYMPDDIVLIEGLEDVLLEGNPLSLSIPAMDPEGVLERFFKEMWHVHRRISTPRFLPQQRRCWLRMLTGNLELKQDFPDALLIEALDCPLKSVRDAANAVLPQLFASPLQKSGPYTILLAGQFSTIKRAELQKVMLASNIQIESRNLLPTTIVVLGDRPGKFRIEALKKGNPVAFEGHLEAWMNENKGEFLAAAPTANPLHENLRRLIRSYRKENIEMALVMMARAGTPLTLLTDLLGIRLFHRDAEVREKAGAAFEKLADRQLKAFVERQIVQHFRQDEDFDILAIVAALIRNPALDAGTLVGAAMELKEAGLELVMLLPEESRSKYLQTSIKDGQLNLSGMSLEAFPSALAQLTGLRYLMLARNHLQRLPNEMAPFSKLEMLDLSENNLLELPEGISELKLLKGLDLSQNRLRNLPEGIWGMQKLEALRLDKNPLQSLPNALSELKGLEMLGLYGCRFSQLPPMIWHLKSLKILDLGQCNIRVLPEVMNGFLELESLGLKDNPIENIPIWVGNLPALRFLDLSHTTARDLPSSFYGQPKLERIYLIRDDSMDWESIVPILASMPKLKHVFLRGRKIVRTMQLLIEEKLPNIRVYWNG